MAREIAKRAIHRVVTRFGGQRIMALVVLRAMVLLAVSVWYAFAPEWVDHRAVGPLVLGFVLYSLAIFALLWVRTWQTVRLNFLVMLVDVAFALALVRLTGGAQSVFYLAFYLIVGLQSYYYGFLRGMGGAGGGGIAYLLVAGAPLAPD